MKINLTLLIMLAAFSLSAQEVLPLYKKIPNSKPTADNEKSTPGRVTAVTIPTLTVFKPQVANPQRSAVIICPGGGYGMLAVGHEGEDVAKALNNFGITAFVLKYRLPQDSIMKDKSIGPLQDAQRAIQMVREGAATWNLDSSKIGIMGFSAGGHLASTASTHFNQEVIDNPKHTSLRPDFSILIYPVISFSDNLTHSGSRTNLIGKEPSAEKIKLYSNELQVTAQTPPAFLVHSADDKAVPVGNSLEYYQALLKNNTLGEMHIYPHGGHGYGMNNKTTESKWIDSLKNWLKEGKYL
ncbi:prolyl oligopeptidase family serine peptidase [Flavobacterium sp. Sd200]|uniref:alpha/beta hydrolase n=1 Tax=Flavobacterium sp. Sd200 TaxID=2692211 RepID=UPI0013714385|nr:alpha/beta hydrolase [Flavobacterium sp. Sd200]MXN89740.1 prolyl oligopeptidase family serine peptidase [Flavobacterium sp. Sd200]